MAPQEPQDTASPEGFRKGALGGLRFNGELDGCLDGGPDGGFSRPGGPPFPAAEGDSRDPSVTGVNRSSRLPNLMSRGLLPLLMVRL